MLASLPDSRLNCRIVSREITLPYFQSRRELPGRYVGWKCYRRVVNRAIGHESGKVALRILIDLHCRKKRNIEIA